MCSMCMVWVKVSMSHKINKLLSILLYHFLPSDRKSASPTDTEDRHESPHIPLIFTGPHSATLSFLHKTRGFEHRSVFVQ